MYAWPIHPSRRTVVQYLVLTVSLIAGGIIGFIHAAYLNAKR